MSHNIGISVEQRRNHKLYGIEMMFSSISTLAMGIDVIHTCLFLNFIV